MAARFGSGVRENGLNLKKRSVYAQTHYLHRLGCSPHDLHVTCRRHGRAGRRRGGGEEGSLENQRATRRGVQLQRSLPVLVQLAAEPDELRWHAGVVHQQGPLWKSEARWPGDQSFWPESRQPDDDGVVREVELLVSLHRRE